MEYITGRGSRYEKYDMALSEALRLARAAMPRNIWPTSLIRGVRFTRGIEARSRLRIRLLTFRLSPGGFLNESPPPPDSTLAGRDARVRARNFVTATLNISTAFEKTARASRKFK